MPDPNQSDPNNPIAPVVPVVQDDTPPIIPDLTTSPVQQDNGSAAPSDFPNIVSAPKKKFGSGKVIATILGLFVLIGGLGAGIYLTQQQQLFQQKAAGPNCLPRVYFNTVATDANGDNAGACKPTTKTFDSNNVSCDGTNQTCDQYLAALSISTGVTKVQGGCFANTAACVSPDGKTVSFRFFYDTVKKSCISTNHRYDSQDIDVDDVNHNTCLWSLDQYQPNARKKCYTSKPSCASDNSIVTNEAPYCQQIKAYSATWSLLTSTQLSALTSGSSVNFCATGVASSGSFDKARFTINGVLQTETTTPRPGSPQDFCQNYTIPAGTTTFDVTAQIHHVTLGWK